MSASERELQGSMRVALRSVAFQQFFLSRIEIDNYSHSQDHSLEVQIPMLQFVLSKKLEILPIILLAQDLETAKDVGYATAEIAKKRNSIIIGSSDFTHYEENSFAHVQDKALIEPILEMNVEKFYQVLKEKRITACGFGAIASTMIACKNLGATKGELLSYATSGDVSGEKKISCRVWRNKVCMKF